jgi:hypothetical protein
MYVAVTASMTMVAVNVCLLVSAHPLGNEQLGPCALLPPNPLLVLHQAKLLIGVGMLERQKRTRFQGFLATHHVVFIKDANQSGGRWSTCQNPIATVIDSSCGLDPTLVTGQESQSAGSGRVASAIKVSAVHPDLLMKGE